MPEFKTDKIKGFKPIEPANAKVLILGSMPGVPSLSQSQYYANPRNSFWSIMAELLDFSKTLEYQNRVEQLIKHRIALWDVIAKCERTGSLDANINARSVVTNNFVEFFERHLELEAVFCNGGRAYRDFNQHVIPTLPNTSLKCYQLLSTSPANARYRYADKLKNWSMIKPYL